MGVKMNLISGYVVEQRMCPEGHKEGQPLPNLPPAKYNTKSIHSWANATWVCGSGDEGRTGLGKKKDTFAWTRVPVFNDEQISCQAVSLGGSVSMYLTSDGKVYTCGFARRGQLADGKLKRWENTTPAAVKNLKVKIVQISAGLDMCFATTYSGLVYAWGSGKHGKLGLGDCENRFLPELVVPLSTGGDTGVVHVAAGAHHAHAITAGGSLYSWGLNKHGQLGVGHDVEFSSVPICCKELRLWKGVVRKIATSSYYSMAIVELPDEDALPTIEKEAKEKVSAQKLLQMRRLFNVRVTSFESIATKSSVWVRVERKIKIHMKKLGIRRMNKKAMHDQIFRDENQSAKTDDVDMVGDADAVGSTTVLDKVRVKELRATYDSLHGTLANGKKAAVNLEDETKATILMELIPDLENILFSRSDLNGQAPNEEKETEKVRKERAGGKRVIEPVHGAQETVQPINRQRAVFVWGYGDIRLGLGEKECRWYVSEGRSPRYRHQYTPRLHRPLSSLVCQTQVSKHSDKLPPPPFTSVTSLALGDEHGLALTEDRRVFVWGNNQYSQLGYRNTLKIRCYQTLPEPKEIVYLNGCLQIAAGKRHSMALRDTGEMYSWGYNNHGQLGHGDKVVRSLPHLCLQFKDRRVQFIACGDEHSVAITSKGSTVLGAPAPVAWPLGVDENGYRYRSSIADIWLPHHRENTALPPTFEGLSRPIFPHGIHVARSRLPPTIVVGKDKTNVRKFPLRISDPIEATFSSRTIWLPSGPFFVVPRNVNVATKKISKTKQRYDYACMLSRDRSWREERDKLFKYKKERNTAGRYIQKWLRGVLVRNRNWHARRVFNSASKIQARIRGKLSRRATKKKHLRLIKAQAVARGYLIRKKGTPTVIARERFLLDNSAISIQMLVRRFQAITKVDRIRKRQMQLDSQLYLAAIRGDLNRVMKSFEYGGKPRGFQDAKGLVASEKAAEKGFFLLCDWLDAKTKKEKATVYAEWLKSDEKNAMEPDDDSRPSTNASSRSSRPSTSTDSRLPSQTQKIPVKSNGRIM